MKTLNQNRLVAIHVRGTGKGAEDPELEGIQELACVLLNSIELDRKVLPLNLVFQPYSEGMAQSMTKKALDFAMEFGVSYEVGISRLLLWLKRIDLGISGRLIPLSYNWPAQYVLLRRALGYDAYTNYFSETENRDLLPICRFWGDYTFIYGSHSCYPKPAFYTTLRRTGIDLCPPRTMTCLQRAGYYQKMYKHLLSIYIPPGMDMHNHVHTQSNYAEAEELDAIDEELQL